MGLQIQKRESLTCWSLAVEFVIGLGNIGWHGNLLPHQLVRADQEFNVTVSNPQQWVNKKHEH
jgi:hypothetical protein